MKIMKKMFDVKGMHCKSCEILIKDSLEEAGGVRDVVASHAKGFVKVDFDESKISQEKLMLIIRNEGYEVAK
jgi:copper chaperone CopZ